jgi:hypothetical protein
MTHLDWPQQRLGADEAHGRGRREQIRDALVGAVLVLGADTERDVREGPD